MASNLAGQAALRYDKCEGLRRKFPTVAAVPELDLIDDPDTLDALLLAVLDSATAAEPNAAILGATYP